MWIYRNKILIILLLILIFLYFITNIYEKLKQDNKKKYNVRKDCNYLQSETVSNIIKETCDRFNYILYLPCIYEDLQDEYNKFTYDDNGIYFLIDNADILIGKEFLFAHVLKKLGYDKTMTLMPKSWVLNKNFHNFAKEFDNNKIYIMKKNVQRQNGLFISNNLNEIQNEYDKDSNENYPFVIIQELLQDPYLISGRKINLRVYVLMVRKEANTELYVYNDGFMYYTAELFEKNSTSKEKNITTGYIDRKVYQDNPLTHKDLRDYLDSDRILTEYEKSVRNSNKNISQIMFNNIYDLILNVFSVFFSKVGNQKKLYKNKKFQLFGCDVAVDDKLNAKIMEINKGPDLGAKDIRDSELKHNLVKNIFKTVNLIDNDDTNGFIKLV
jgi:hypothetical protein